MWCNVVEIGMLEFFFSSAKKVLVSISLKLFFPHVIAGNLSCMFLNLS